MKLKLWQVDAFAARPLEGNPAAVVPLERWLDESLMQAIAAENNLSETAFFVQTAPGAYDLRWFTPNREVDLCGHATLASAHVVFSHLDKALDMVRFQTRSGELVVQRGEGGRNVMSLPASPSTPFTPPSGFADALGKSLHGPAPSEFHVAARGGAGARALIAVWEDPAQIKALDPAPDLKDVAMQVQAGSVLATARGDGAPYDMVSRFFAPYYGVPEDPVTGSAHCALTPFWAQRLGKREMQARQASPRGGDLYVTDAGDRILIAGDCALYLTGEIEL